MKGLIRWNPQSGSNGRYELVAENNSKKVIARSKHTPRLFWMVESQQPVVRQAGVTGPVSIISRNPKESHGVVVTNESDAVVSPVVEVQDDRPQFSINERFEFLSDLVDMVINKSASSILITGRGGIGKTWTVMGRLTESGMVDTATILPRLADLERESIIVEDTEEQIEEKAYAEINRPSGDYVIVKGRVTPKACYRLLYENRKKMIVFDDCDSVLQNDDCVNLLKAALDSYEERYVSWRTESPFSESDLPQSFKFEGSIVFISNLPMNKVDEAVRTRCFKVDVSMNTQQRLERMKAVLEGVMPEVDMQLKLEALEVLEENQHLTDDINFRSLMKTITIRQQDKPNWKKLAAFSLLEQ